MQVDHSAQRRAFEAEGIARLPGALPAADVDAMRASLGQALAGIDLAEVTGALRPGPGSAD
ncbi:MAG TPA: hypothetical protein VL172_06700, partial [Kofleriaceae bacterium]|nr:hypothetical protein [Kofleriaceae bacterium]